MKRRTFILSLLAASCRARAPQAPVPAPKTATKATFVAPSDLPNPLKLGLMPVLDPAILTAEYAAFSAHLSEKLGTHVELNVSRSYSAAIDDIVSGAVDVAQLTPLAYVGATLRQPELTPLVGTIADGSSTYSCYLVARRTLNIRSPEQLKGRVLGLVSKHSASGYLYPYAFLLSHGIDPKTDCKLRFFERHDKLLLALAAGEIDVCGTYLSALNHAETQGVDMSGSETIAKTGRIPHDAWVARAGLSPRDRAAVRDVFLNVSTRTRNGRLILAPIRSIHAFSKVDDAHYDQVRSVRKEVTLG